LHHRIELQLVDIGGHVFGKSRSLEREEHQSKDHTAQLHDGPCNCVALIQQSIPKQLIQRLLLNEAQTVHDTVLGYIFMHSELKLHLKTRNKETSPQESEPEVTPNTENTIHVSLSA